MSQPPHQPGRRAPRGAAIVVAVLVLLSALVMVGVRVAAGLSSADSAWNGPPAVLTSDASPSPSPSPSLSEAIPASFPKSGPGTWRYCLDEGPVLGNIQHFQVAIETNVAAHPAGIAAKVDQALGDPRSWIAGRTFRLQRVPATAPYDVTIYLATKSTSTRMCAAGGSDTDAHTPAGGSGK